jgi:hypothetical protein
MPRVIVCDVNETLLDVGELEPHFKQAFGEGRVLQDWFANVLLYSEVATLARARPSILLARLEACAPREQPAAEARSRYDEDQDCGPMPDQRDSVARVRVRKTCADAGETGSCKHRHPSRQGRLSAAPRRSMITMPTPGSARKSAPVRLERALATMEECATGPATDESGATATEYRAARMEAYSQERAKAVGN